MKFLNVSSDSRTRRWTFVVMCAIGTSFWNLVVLFFASRVSIGLLDLAHKTNLETTVPVGVVTRKWFRNRRGMRVALVHLKIIMKSCNHKKYILKMRSCLALCTLLSERERRLRNRGCEYAWNCDCFGSRNEIGRFSFFANRRFFGCAGSFTFKSWKKGKSGDVA